MFKQKDTIMLQTKNHLHVPTHFNSIEQNAFLRAVYISGYENNYTMFNDEMFE